MSPRPAAPRPARLAPFGAWLTLTTTAAAAPALDVVLLDAALRPAAPAPVSLTAIDERGLTYTTAGLVRTEPLAEFAALIAAAPAPDAHDAPATPRAGLLELVDGQRLAGQLEPDHEPEGERLLWRHDVYGVLAIPLERIAAVRLDAQSAPGDAPDPGAAGDVVILANGDRLEGFVESIGPAVWIEVGGDSRAIERSLVRTILLSNPAEPPAGTMLWLADGSVVRVEHLRTSRLGDLLFDLRLEQPAAPAAIGGTPDPREPELPEWAGRLRLADLRAIAFDASRLVPLGTLEPVAQEPIGGRRWSEPVTAGRAAEALLGAPDVTIPGPLRAEWPIPEGATRLAMQATLPPDMWTWGDCELVVESVEASGAAAELARARLNAARPAHDVNVALPAGPGARVRLRLEPGAYGPVQDRIVLKRPVFLIDGLSG